MAVRTVFSMVEDCARGERQGWLELVRDYGVLARTLLAHYFPMLAPEMEMHLGAIFERARANDNAWFRELHFANEREFLMAWRQFLFEYGRSAARVPTPELSLEQIREIMKDLPVLEREMLWLFIKGYQGAPIAAMMMDAEATAEATRRVADQRLKQILPGASPQAFNVSARVLIEAAEKTATPQCLALRTFNNLVNGQISWRERELSEEHIRDCFYCLDRFTSFLEMMRLRKETPALAEEETAAILARLNLPAAKGKGLLGRLFAH